MSLMKDLLMPNLSFYLRDIVLEDESDKVNDALNEFSITISLTVI